MSKTIKKSLKCPFCKNLFATENNIKEHVRKNRCLSLRKIMKKQNTNNNEINGTNNGNGIIHGNETVNVNIVNIPIKVSKSIKLNSYQHDNIDTLTLDDIMAVVECPYGIIIGLLKVINFNINRPENHNIYYPNIKNGNINTFTTKWGTETIKVALHTIVEVKMETLDFFLDKTRTVLNDLYIRKLEQTVKDFTIVKMVSQRNK
jgi:hypothetical protein